MAEDLLLELEMPGVAGSLENIEDLVRALMTELGDAAASMRGSARLFEDAWQRMVVEVANGQTAEVHAARPRLGTALQNRLGLLKHAHQLSTCLRSLGRAEAPDPLALEQEIAGLEALKIHVFDRWQTPDDLEDLAARDYPLTTADLDRLGPSRRPPPAFYADESKPF